MPGAPWLWALACSTSNVQSSGSSVSFGHALADHTIAHVVNINSCFKTIHDLVLMENGTECLKDRN